MPPHRVTLAIVALLAASPLAAQQAPRGQSAAPTNAPLTDLGSNNRDPIKIDADRLDVRDRDNTAVFSGNVVAVQGRTTIRCSKLTIVYENRPQATGQRPPARGQQPAAPTPASLGGDGGIKVLECEGPVTVTSDDQVATSQRATFDRSRDLVIMTGDVALAKGPNVTRGERLTYNTKTGVANIDGGRVRGFFVPGSADQPAAAPARRP